MQTIPLSIPAHACTEIEVFDLQFTDVVSVSFKSLDPQKSAANLKYATSGNTFQMKKKTDRNTFTYNTAELKGQLNGKRVYFCMIFQDGCFTISPPYRGGGVGVTQ